MADPIESHPIHKLMTTWHEASRNGDLPTILSLMADDVVFLIADHPPMTRQNFIDSFSAIREQIQMQVVEWHVDELEESGNLAYCRSYLHLAISPNAGGRPVERKGPILSIFRKKADGNWVLARDANFLTTIE